MRSKYSVNHSERVANASKTLEILGVSLELITSTLSPFYSARLSDDDFAAFWTRQSNEPVPAAGDIVGLTIGDFRAVRFDHISPAYISLTIPANKALDLIESGAAAEGIKLQPAIAG